MAALNSCPFSGHHPSRKSEKKAGTQVGRRQPLLLTGYPRFRHCWCMNDKSSLLQEKPTFYYFDQFLGTKIPVREETEVALSFKLAAERSLLQRPELLRTLTRRAPHRPSAGCGI